MNDHQLTACLERIENAVLGLRMDVLEMRAQLHEYKHALKQMEDHMAIAMQDITDALTKLSTSTDTLSLKTDALQAGFTTYSGKVDKLITDVTGLITAVQNNVPVIPPAVADAVAKAQASADAANAEGVKVDAAVASAAAAGDKVDAAVAAADKVLPTPAPAGTP